jgi:hypothetical protein
MKMFNDLRLIDTVYQVTTTDKYKRPFIEEWTVKELRSLSDSFTVLIVGEGQRSITLSFKKSEFGMLSSTRTMEFFTTEGEASEVMETLKTEWKLKMIEEMNK